jgi:phenylpropionate dioxygenase-like ring-hydroxylating dioxygenase large terminal subunit
MTSAPPHAHFDSPQSALNAIVKSPEATWWQPACELPSSASTTIAKACVLGVDVVLWRTASGWHAALDQCPHRGAALSNGCVKGEALHCPYHGWEFGPRGACTLIPAIPSFTPPAGHGLSTFAVCEYAGLLWVQLSPNDEALQPASLFREHTRHLSRAATKHVLCGPYEVATSAPRVIENFLDLSHFGTVHAGWLGDAAHMALEPYTVETTANEALATDCRVWQPQSQATLQGETAGAWVDYTYRVAHPYCAMLTKLPQAAGGISESIAVFVCPMNHTQSRVWFSMVMQDVGQSDESVQAFQHTIFMQDAPVLLSQRPALLPLDQSAEKHSAADRMSAAYRGLLRSWKVRYGIC